MKISTRLYLSSTISIILMGLLFGGIFFTSKKVAKQEEKHKLTHTIQLTISELHILANEYALHQENRIEEQWSLQYNSTSELVTVATAVATDAEDKEITGQINADYAALGGLFKEIVANYKEREKLVQEPNSSQEIVANTEYGDRLTSQLLIKSQTIFANAVRYAKKASAEVDSAQKTSNGLIIFLTVINLLNIIITTLIVSRKISRSLTSLQHEFTRIAGLDFSSTTTTTTTMGSKDELGELARAFDKMTGKLKESYAGLEQKVLDRTRDLDAANQQLKASNQQLRASNQQLDASTQQLRAANQQLTATGKELKETIRALEVFNKAAVGRELKMVELKKEIETLKKQAEHS